MKQAICIGVTPMNPWPMAMLAVSPWDPLLTSGTLFPRGIGNQHAPDLIRQVNARGLVQTEAAGLRCDEVGADADAVIIKEDVAALGDGLAQGDDAMVGGAACTLVAVEDAISDPRRSFAFNSESFRGEPAVAQPGDRDDQFERGARGINARDRQIGPGLAVMDVLGGGRAQPGGELVEIIVRFAGENEHLAGAHIEGDGRALERLELGDRLLGGHLQVDIQADIQPLTLARGTFVQRRIDPKAGGIDAKDGAARFALEQGVELQFESVAAGACP